MGPDVGEICRKHRQIRMPQFAEFVRTIKSQSGARGDHVLFAEQHAQRASCELVILVLKSDICEIGWGCMQVLRIVTQLIQPD